MVEYYGVQVAAVVMFDEVLGRVWSLETSGAKTFLLQEGLV